MSNIYSKRNFEVLGKKDDCLLDICLQVTRIRSHF